MFPIYPFALLPFCPYALMPLCPFALLPFCCYFTQCFAKKLCPCTCTLRCYLSNIYGKGKGNVWGQNIVWNKGKRAKIRAKPQTNRMPIFLDSWRMFGALPQGNINTSSEPCDVALIPDICQSLHHLIINARNERVSPSKRINFRKCSKGPLPPSFLENHVAIFFRNSWPKYRL